MRNSKPVKKIEKVRVIKGASRGKRIGIPTVNFKPNIVRNLKDGIYICRVTFNSLSFWGVLHFGPRPTFGEWERTLEVHLFDFGGEPTELDTADIEIYDFIRAVLEFESVEAMIKEIENDINLTKKRIKEYGFQV